MLIPSTSRAETHPSFCAGRKKQLPKLGEGAGLGWGLSCPPLRPRCCFPSCISHLFSFHPKSPFSSRKNLCPPQEISKTSPAYCGWKGGSTVEQELCLITSNPFFSHLQGDFLSPPRWWRHPGVSSPLPSRAPAPGAALGAAFAFSPRCFSSAPRFPWKERPGGPPRCRCPQPGQGMLAQGAELCPQPDPIPQLRPLPPPCTWEMFHNFVFFIFFPIFSPSSTSCCLFATATIPPLCWVPVR